MSNSSINKAEILKNKTQKRDRMLSLVLLFGAAFIVHIVCAACYVGYETDMNCFFWWSKSVFEEGISKFYYLDMFTDYPPGYMYILWVIGGIIKLLGLVSFTDLPAIILLKLPAMICDLVIGYVIYKVAVKYTKHSYALLFSAVFMLNPAVIINSATWGQVDSIYTLFVVLMCYFVTEKKLPAAYFMFAIGILIKPQTLIFTPVLIYGIIDQVFLNDFSWKRMFTQLGIGLSAIAALVLAAVPFNLEKVIPQYVDTLGQYEYASVNAYNLWALLGKNWTSQDDMFMFLSYKNWGTIFIIATVVVSAIFCLKNKEKESKYYLSGAFIVTSVFMLSARMHERYMYPVMALLLVAAVVKRKYPYFIAYACLSIVLFLNEYHVLFYYDNENYDFHNPVIYTISAMSVAAFVYFCYVYFNQIKCKRAYTYSEIAEMSRAKQVKGKNGKGINSRNTKSMNSKTGGRATGDKNAQAAHKKGLFAIRPSEKPVKWCKWDWIIVSAITIIYACIAFYNLGGFKAPQTTWSSNEENTELVFDLGESRSIDHMYSFLGSYENRKFLVQSSDDGVNWQTLNYKSDEDEQGVYTIVSVFCWNKIDTAFTGRYVKLTHKPNQAAQKPNKVAVNEFMIYDTDGNVILPVNASDYPELFDEQDIFDGTSTYMNSTYFDEIYHARTAYEMIHNMYCYEMTHPPLGKAIMAIGILIFGMCPFGWRFMGTLFGVIMVPVMYLLGKKLTKKTWLSSVITLLFTFDFMHFTQTRIATIDVFVTLFIMLMYFFMLCYYKLSFYDTPVKKTFIPLALSGICMGLGCASKWTGVYAGLGLGVIFAAVMIRRYGEYRTAMKDPKGSTEGIEHQYVIDNYSSLMLKTLGFCVLAFVVVPVIIYTLSYIPFSDDSSRNVVGRMIENQRQMYSYHSTLDATHPYSSTWYQWPVINRPILYYLEDAGENLKVGISAMGNPFVWWAGIPAFLYMIYLAIAKKERTSLFLAIGYLAQYVPWMGVSRCTFIYHYFPSVPFVVLMVGYSIYKITESKPKLKIAAFVYTAAVIGLFIAFYPVIAGYPTTVEYVKHLKWLSSWVLLF